MEIRKEKAFPRGGKNPALFKSKKTSSLSLFRKPKTKIKKKSKKGKNLKQDILPKKTIAKQSNNILEVKYVEDLKASVVQEGMLILGIVSQITDKVVNVSLPGGLRGVIDIANVSAFYSDMITNMKHSSKIPTLKQLFQVGDVLPVKVLSVSEKHASLQLTSDPKLINEKLSYSLIEEGLILFGSIKSKEEYGFILDFGIDHVNGFLHFEKVDEDRNLEAGKLLRCVVVKVNKSSGSCNIQLSILKKDLQNSAVKKNSSLPLYCFVPGVQFEIIFKKKLTDGVEVSYNKNDSLKGYIYEDYFLKLFPNLANVELGTECIATLLYVKPFVNFLYFKIMPKKPVDLPFKYGEIVSGQVIKTKKSGVMFKCALESKKAKCFVPISKLKKAKEIEEKSDIVNLYPVNKKVSKIRLSNFNFMGRYYLGATDDESLHEKYYSFSDLKCGEVISSKIVFFGKSTARLKIGKTITGIVRFIDMTDIPMRNPLQKFKVGQTVRARVIEIIPEKRFLRLTMKPSLIKEKELLFSLKDCQKDKVYVGTIFKVLQNKLIVKFCNHISGIIPKRLTPHPDCVSLKENYYDGQVVKCSVIKINDNKQLLLSLLFGDSDCNIEAGKKYNATVFTKSKSGLFLDVYVDKNKTCKGFLPLELLTIHRSLSAVFHSLYSVGEKLSVHCILNDTSGEIPIFGTLEFFNEFYKEKTEEEFQKLLTSNSILPFLYKNKNHKSNTIFLYSLIPQKNKLYFKIVKDELPSSIVFSKYQLLYGKILNVGEKKVNVSIKLSDVWDKDFHTSLDLLDSYLGALDNLIGLQKSKLQSYSLNTKLGCSVKGVIEEIRSTHAIVRTEDSVLGIIKGKYVVGEEVRGKVFWIDPLDQVVYISANNPSMEISQKALKFTPQNDNVRGKILFINEEVIVVELKGRGTGHLAFLPRKRHLNDFTPVENVFTIGEEIKVWVTRKNSNFILAMDQRVVSLQEKLTWKKAQEKLQDSVQSLKRKLVCEKMERGKIKKSKFKEEEEIEVVDMKLGNKNVSEISEKNNHESNLPEIKKEVVVVDESISYANNDVPQLEYDNIDIKSENDFDAQEKQKPYYRIENDERINLSSSSESEDEDSNTKSMNPPQTLNVGFNWNVLNNQSLLSGIALQGEESSEDDDDESKLDKKKRRRLTAIEKKEKAKSEEERLRYIEEKIMDTEREPETVDDFDRAVLGNPNSSALWLKYMAFHIQGTEIEKARAVARRALKAISFREEQEKLNIWIALLNLENIYGNEDSFNKTQHEALQCNDPYKIHFHILNIYGQGNKFQDMERLGNFILKKYKNLEHMWIDVAGAYFAVGKLESARNVLQKALNVIDKNQRISLISKFAHLENKYGSPERAQTLYESILASFPKRVDIWCCYVDLLVKSNHFDLARQVLERATSQSLRPRKMKTLFKKFLTFEETHGTPENVEKVREAAVEYVKTVGAMND